MTVATTGNIFKDLENQSVDFFSSITGSGQIMREVVVFDIGDAATISEAVQMSRVQVPGAIISPPMLLGDDESQQVDSFRAAFMVTVIDVGRGTKSERRFDANGQGVYAMAQAAMIALSGKQFDLSNFSHPRRSTPINLTDFVAIDEDNYSALLFTATSKLRISTFTGV